ncbi:GRAM domain-containing protein 2B-like [Mugil cephalus]|uniref:GRAM domain-containing protein 2B-like n=1 Tax=Mugil cephalus TaxID=48193 RepID=UPI001FB7B7A7|nr:GRAM domain-containing protein 2B-like [Mugil cephalus]
MCVCVCVFARMVWKSQIIIMSVKNRKFSLDSSVTVDGAGHLGTKKGSSLFSSKKHRHSQSLDEARQEMQELKDNLNFSRSLREQTIAEENLERSDGLINNHNFLKRNKSFHKLFAEIPEGENLTHTFTCALQKEVLYHGKLFVSENHVCFHSSVLLKDTKVVFPVSSVKEVKKHHSALSMLSIQTADGEKHSFVSLRNREMCYKLLQSLCLHAQGDSPNGSPHMSSTENEVGHDMMSSYSSLDDSMDHDFPKVPLDDDFPQTPSEATESERKSEGTAACSSLIKVFYVYMMLLVLLLFTSGYIGQRIVALQEQLNSLGSLTELTSQHTEQQ